MDGINPKKWANHKMQPIRNPTEVCLRTPNANIEVSAHPTIPRIPFDVVVRLPPRFFVPFSLSLARCSVFNLRV
jgi:hypothetical protein